MESSDCKHHLRPVDLIFATKSAAKRCDLCGEFVYLDTPFLENGFGVSVVAILAALAFSVVQGGLGWLSLPFAVAILPFSYWLDVRAGRLFQYHRSLYVRERKWTRVAFGVFVSFVGLVGVYHSI